MSEQSNKDMSKHFYRASAADFMKIPGSPVAYWVSDKLREVFAENPLISEIAEPKQGLATGNNDIYLRYWFEVSLNNVKFDCVSQDESANAPEKWYPCQKGGGFRRWYGNLSFLVNWQHGGKDLKAFKPNSVIRNPQYYFREGGTWSSLSSGGFSMRYSPKGFIFESKGSICFTNQPKHLPKLISFSNSKVIDSCLLALSPTLDYHEGPYGRVPFVDVPDNGIGERFKLLVTIAKTDWDSFELSWEFKENPLVQEYERKESKSLASSYSNWLCSNQKTILLMQQLEEENNRIFIDAYGLQDEHTPEVSTEEITLTVNTRYRYGDKLSDEDIKKRFLSDSISELISYSIGCMMGRYSLDKPGLILASQGETLQDYLAQIPSPRFMPDDDAILPLTDQEWFTDDVTNRFREFVKVVWGEDTLQENLEFVAESLCLHAIKPKKSETAMDTIRRYLSTQFFVDHMKTYKKRPIYWLFSSGKQKAFECLVYLHRYNEGTLSRMRTEYVTPLMGKYESQIRHNEEQQETASTAEKNKLSKALKGYQSKLNELREFDNKLKHYADRRISLDLDDGVKVNYGKFGDLLAKVKEITGKAPETD